MSSNVCCLVIPKELINYFLCIVLHVNRVVARILVVPVMQKSPMSGKWRGFSHLDYIAIYYIAIFKMALSYRKLGAPDRIRTCDLSLRRRTLYPLSYWGWALLILVGIALSHNSIFFS